MWHRLINNPFTPNTCSILAISSRRNNYKSHIRRSGGATWRRPTEPRGGSPKYVIKSTFAATTKLAKEVVYRDPLMNNIKSRDTYLNCVFLNDSYDTDIMFESEPELTG